MYTGLLHTHTLLVSIYIILFAIKLILLLGNQREKLAIFRKRTRLFEMIIPVLFLATGVYLALNSAYVADTWFVVKVILLVIAIGLGVLTFRTANKVFGVLTLLIFIYIFGISYTKTPDFSNRLDEIDVIKNTDQNFDPGNPDYDKTVHGLSLYQQFACATCHGDTGDKGLSGAKDLTRSELSESEAKAIIKNGKNSMPPYEGRMSDKELEAITAYVKRMRK